MRFLHCREPQYFAAAHLRVVSVTASSVEVPYLLNQTLLSISRRSRIVAAHPEVLNEIVAALEY